MLTYEYECESCGFRFEHRQSITEEPAGECPKCHGKAHRLISGGGGILLKGGGNEHASPGGDSCCWEQTGTTCCGRDRRCDKTPCGSGL